LHPYGTPHVSTAGQSTDDVTIFSERELAIEIFGNVFISYER